MFNLRRGLQDPQAPECGAGPPAVPVPSVKPSRRADVGRVSCTSQRSPEAPAAIPQVRSSSLTLKEDGSLTGLKTVTIPDPRPLVHLCPDFFPVWIQHQSTQDVESSNPGRTMLILPSRRKACRRWSLKPARPAPAAMGPVISLEAAEPIQAKQRLPGGSGAAS